LEADSDQATSSKGEPAPHAHTWGKRGSTCTQATGLKDLGDRPARASINLGVARGEDLRRLDGGRRHVRPPAAPQPGVQHQRRELPDALTPRPASKASERGCPRLRSSLRSHNSPGQSTGDDHPGEIRKSAAASGRRARAVQFATDQHSGQPTPPKQGPPFQRFLNSVGAKQPAPPEGGYRGPGRRLCFAQPAPYIPRMTASCVRHDDTVSFSKNPFYS